MLESHCLFAFICGQPTCNPLYTKKAYLGHSKVSLMQKCPGLFQGCPLRGVPLYTLFIRSETAILVNTPPRKNLTVRFPERLSVLMLQVTTELQSTSEMCWSPTGPTAHLCRLSCWTTLRAEEGRGRMIIDWCSFHLAVGPHCVRGRERKNE